MEVKDIFRVRVGKTTDKRNGKARFFYSSDRTSAKTNNEYMESRGHLEFIFRNNITELEKSTVLKKWGHKNFTIGEISLAGKSKLKNHFLYV